MTTQKYLIQVAVLDTIESRCIKYIASLVLAKCCTEISCIVADVTESQVIGSEDSGTGFVLSKGIINIMHWLSFRNFTSDATNQLVQLLCGNTKDHKREIARALKRVISWSETWTDYTTPIATQLKLPTCGHILFDKKLRHRGITFMLECDANSTNNAAHLTIADVHLTMTICKWLTAFEHEKDLIVAIIPAVVNYVKDIRIKLKELELQYNSTIDVFAMYFDAEHWVDSALVAAGNTHVFKFTQKERSSKMSKSDTFNSVTDEHSNESAVIPTLLDIERTAQGLVNTVHWRTSVAFDDELSSSLLDLSGREDMWEKMKLPDGRQVRKTQQIKSLLREISTVLPLGGVAVEFCSGGGYVGIPLAVLRPDCTVLLTDMNTVSLMYAKARVEALGLTNVKFLREELAGIEALQRESDATKPTGGVREPSADHPNNVTESQMLSVFHVGIALHACGTATDAVLRICTRTGASFVVSPCCYGFLQHQAATATASESVERLEEAICRLCISSAPDNTDAARCGCGAFCTTTHPVPSSHPAPYTSYPASQAFRACGWQDRWFAALCSQADRTFWSHDARADTHNEKGHLAMRVVDTDRLLAAQECGYSVFGTFMWPAEASVKNHILVGTKIRI